MVLLERPSRSIHPLIERLPAALLPQALRVADPSEPAAIAAILRRGHTVLAAAQPVRLAGLICQGLRIPQQTRAGCLRVVAAVRSLTMLGSPPVIAAAAAVLDEESAWRP